MTELKQPVANVLWYRGTVLAVPCDFFTQRHDTKIRDLASGWVVSQFEISCVAPRP
jgi:hypothetical protein